jgi:hypothetical protein
MSLVPRECSAPVSKCQGKGKKKVIPVHNHVIKHHAMKAYEGEEMQLCHSWPRHYKEVSGQSLASASSAYRPAPVPTELSRLLPRDWGLFISNQFSVVDSRIWHDSLQRFTTLSYVLMSEWPNDGPTQHPILWSWDLLEKLVNAQSRIFPPIMEPEWSFITLLRRVRYCMLSWGR